MDDLISRQDAIDEAKEWIDAVYFEENDKRERKAIECFIGSLKNIPSAQPTADVRENVRGEWEEIEVIAEAYDISGVKTWASKMKCDQCGFTTIAIEGHFSQYNFCPNCGAGMRSKSC